MKNGKNITRKKVLVMAIVISNVIAGIFMVLPPNASAVMVNITGLETGYDQGSIIDIIADIYIENLERIPIQDLDLEIRGPTDINASFQVNGAVISSSSWINITLLSIVGTEDNYSYGYGYEYDDDFNDYYNYDYGYRYGYDHGVNEDYDFGYGYGYVGRLKYSVRIDTSFMATGNYTMQLHANTGSIIHARFSSEVRIFSILPVGESGSSWPQFQNNAAHTGYSTSEAPDYDYMVWKQPCYNGNTGRYPIIDSGFVVISGQGTKKLWCYEEETGSLVWQYNSTGYVCPGPAIYDGSVIFTTRAYNNATMINDGLLYSIALQSGQINWHIRFPGEENIVSARITVADNHAFISSYYHLYCIDLRSQSMSWVSSPTYLAGYSNNAPLVAAGSVFVYADNYIYIYDSITGKLKYNLQGGYIYTPLAISNGKLIYGTLNRNIIARDVATLNILWSYPIPDPAYVVQPMAFAYGNAYFVYDWYDSYIGQYRGKLVSINTSNGTLDWSYEFPGYCYFYGGPAVADGKIYISTTQNIIGCFDAFNGTLIWSLYGWTDSDFTTPSIANGKVFFSSRENLYCFGLDKYAPTHRWEYPAINGRTNDPSPQIYVIVEDQSGMVESSIRMYVNGVAVFFQKSPVGEGYWVGYDHEGTFYNGQNVSVKILAEDVHGNKLDFTWHFIVDLTPPTVVSYSPTGTDVSLETDIRITFNEPIGGGNLWISPSVSGFTSWEGNILIFTQDFDGNFSAGLEYNTVYTVYLWNAWDLAGNYLATSFEWNFSTEITELVPPSHSNEYPQDGTTILNNTPMISVWVTDLSGVVQDSIRLYIDGYSVFYELQSVQDGFNVSYYWGIGFDYGRTIVCRIVAEDIYGNRLDYSWGFTVLSVMTHYNIPVHAGWNLISLPLIPSNSSMPDALMDTDGDTVWDVVKWYDGNSKSWQSHRIGFSTALMNCDQKMGFWIYITETGDGFLNISGSQPSTTLITLNAGWNLVGYPSKTQRIAAETLPGQADMIAIYKDGSPWIEDHSDLQMVMLSQGNGYWVHVTADCVWAVYP